MIEFGNSIMFPFEGIAVIGNWKGGNFSFPFFYGSRNGIKSIRAGRRESSKGGFYNKGKKSYPSVQL